MINKYTKKPVTIEAVQWNGDNTNEIISFCGSCCVPKQTYLIIQTLEGNHIADIGGYIIKGIKGEFYPCKPDIFKNTYSKAD